MRNREKIIGSIVILICFGIFAIIGFKINNSNEKGNAEDIFVEADNNSIEIKDTPKPVNSQIRVEIKGDVKSPDVYTLNYGSIVLDLVKAAGGYSEDADKDSIIQATKLNDGDCVYVKKKGEMNINNGVSLAKPNGKININTASKEELMKLDGIGESRAEKIIEYRQQNGMFKSVEELKKVGARIGDSIIKNIKDKIETN